MVAAGLCFAADSVEILLLSFLSVVLQSSSSGWDISQEQTSMLTSTVFLGAMLGTLILGPLGDKVGRKPIFVTTAAILSLAGIGTAFTASFGQLMFLRFLVGAGVGGLTVPFDTLAEFVPTSQRGQNLLAIEYFWTAGTVLCPVLALLTLGGSHSEGDRDPWRLFVFACSIPCAVSLILGWIYVPESPRWLMIQGKHDEALQVLRQAAATNGKDGLETFPEGTRLLADDVAGEAEGLNFMHLFSRGWWKITLLMWITWFSFAFLYYGSVQVITEIFADDGNEYLDGDDETGYSFDYSAIFVSATAEIAGTSLIMFLVDRLGRIRSQAYSYLAGGVSICLLCLLASNENTNRFLMIVIAFLARMFFMSASCATWVSTAEILTTEVRSTGHAASNAVARLGGSLSPLLVSGKMSYPIMAVVLLAVSICTFASASQLPETAGKALGASSQPYEEPSNKTLTSSDKEEVDETSYQIL